jgi:hypothetical protein
LCKLPSSKSFATWEVYASVSGLHDFSNDHVTNDQIHLGISTPGRHLMVSSPNG